MEEKQGCTHMDFVMDFETGHAFQYFSSHSYAEAGRKTEARVSLGLETARLGLRRGDNHFQVIQRHECSADVCFLI
jgi:hypothetical protein